MTATISAPFRLGANLTADKAASLVEAFRHLPHTSSTEWVLDASEVQELTTSGAQILLALHKCAAAIDSTLSLTGQSPAFTRAMADLGLSWLHKSSR